MKIIEKWIKSKISSTSKQLLWFVNIMFWTQVFVSIWVRTKYNVDLTSFLGFTSPVYASVIISYTTKAYQEKKLSSTVVQNNQQ